MKSITILIAWALCAISTRTIGAEKQKDVVIMKPLRTFGHGHKGSVSGVTFSNNGKLLASASKVAQLWELPTGNVLMTVPGDDVGYFDVKLSSNGELLALPGYYGTIKLWNVETQKAQRLLMGHKGRVFSVDFSPDGKLLASGGGPDDGPGQMKIWQLSTGDEISYLSKEHPSFVNSVAFSPNGKLLASASRNLVRVWNVETGVLIETFHAKETNEKHLNIFALAFSPDGNLLASGDSHAVINVWDLKSVSLKYRLLGHTDNITSVDFSPNGKSLASAGSYDHTARIWNLASGELSVTFKTPGEDVDCVAFSPDGKVLATGGGGSAIRDTGNVFLWTVPNEP